METKSNKILVTSFASNVARMGQYFIAQKRPVDQYAWLAAQCKEFIKQQKNVVI